MIPTGQTNQSSVATEAPNGRAAGVVILVASILTLVFFAAHPAIHSHDLGEAVAEMSRIATTNMLVHGVLIAMMGAFVLGFWGLTEQLASSAAGHSSARLILSRGGLVAYAMGALAMMGAATVNGFFVTGLALQYHDLEPARMEPLRALLVFCHTANATLDVMGIVGMSIGVFLWSLLLMATRRSDGGTRIIGALGVLIGAALPVLLIAGHPAMTMHGMGAFLLAQMLWNMAVATQMIRGRI